MDDAALKRDSRFMATDLELSILFERTDRSRNMARFYSLSVQPTLFGGTSLVRNWGRIGTSGQMKIHTFDRDAEATAAFARLARIKRRRGYRDLPTHAASPS